jgi:tetratricopeptide (TPR) repeat protein
MLEDQWVNAIKNLENAMKIHRNIPDYSLAMGECMMHLDRYKEAIQHFGNVVRLKPKNKAGWEALIRCLYKAEFFEEAVEQCEAAIRITDRSIFIFYYTAVLFALGRSKEALLQLEKGMEKSPKLLKKLVDLNPSVLQNSQVVDLIARYKKGRKI